ncbi:MAG: ribose-phosphate pyrophosphokinase, partial [Romboutsia sp.]|nr:ribose-phosphate pyrophosphokinase [Romboutsia sp.]
MVLNLDKDFKLFNNKEEIAFESFIFSGGEPHIKIKSIINTSEVFVTQRIKSFNDFGLLLMAINALRNMNVNQIQLFVPYFPAARQDRKMVKGEPLSVKVYTDILNSFDLKSITIFDPHSDVVTALLNKCITIDNHIFIKQVLNNLPNDTILISPDGGALKKIYKLAESIGNIDVVECSKKRNVNTGTLNSFIVYTENLNNQSCLIVDDICDGGRTFIGLAEELKKKNAGKLYLAVSHGIFSNGTEDLLKYFDGIYCTDSFKSIEYNNINQ